MEERLAPEKETTLFRILQESLENSIRYASAERIYVSLIKIGDRVLLSVEDDGNGFDSDVLSGGRNTATAGIALMKERTVQAGGEFWIESQPGKGTSVMAEIPAD
jgi:signal transduction histidine kinase